MKSIQSSVVALVFLAAPSFAGQESCPTIVIEAQTQGRICVIESVAATQAAHDAQAKCLQPVLPPSTECTEALKKAQQAAADVAKCIGTAIQGCQLGAQKACESAPESAP